MNLRSQSHTARRKLGRGREWWAAAACVLVLASAAAAFQTPAPEPPKTDPKKDADLPPEIVKLPFEIRDGYRRFQKRCTTCHDTKRVDEAKKTLFEWQGTVGTMAFKKGANIPMEDRHAIFIYLTYLHGTRHNKPEEKEEYLAFLRKCEDCHGIGLVYRDKKPMKDWPNIIHRMAAKTRADITPEDEKRIMNYIGRMHPDVFGID